jgi:hypothetical protein
MLPYLHRERTRNAKSPSKVNEAIVIVDGQRRNVSNLVISSRQPAPEPEPSLYPVISDLPTLETTDQVFKEAQQRASSTGSLEDKWGAAFSSLEEGDEKYQEEDEQVQGGIDSSRQEDEASTVSCHDRQMVEVTPGFFVPLCGAAETGQAVDRGEIQPVVCFGCNIRLLVINKASMVICPECDMISPLFGGGDVILGLGLREETFPHDVLGEEEVDADSEGDPLANDPFKTKNLDDDQDWGYHSNFSQQRL